MSLSIAIIGYGVVGRACHKAFEYNADAVIVDPLHSRSTMRDVAAVEPALVFVAVNAPTLENGDVDASNVYTVFQQLTDIGCTVPVVLKTTLPPSIIDDLYNIFALDLRFNKDGPLRFIYSPEFLREAEWAQDALYQPSMLLAGDYSDCQEVKRIYDRHSHATINQYRFVDYKEAAFIKYAINSFLALKVVFFNQLQQVYEDTYDSDSRLIWSEVVTSIKADPRMGISHMDVPGDDGKYGYGGSCFPKDVKAFLKEDKMDRLTLLKEAELVNTKIRMVGKLDHDK